MCCTMWTLKSCPRRPRSATEGEREGGQAAQEQPRCETAGCGLAGCARLTRRSGATGDGRGRRAGRQQRAGRSATRGARAGRPGAAPRRRARAPMAGRRDGGDGTTRSGARDASAHSRPQFAWNRAPRRRQCGHETNRSRASSSCSSSSRACAASGGSSGATAPAVTGPAGSSGGGGRHRAPDRRRGDPRGRARPAA